MPPRHVPPPCPPRHVPKVLSVRSDGRTVSTVLTEALVDGSTRAVTQTNGVTFSVRDGATGGATGGTGTRGMSDVRGALDDSGSVSDGGSGGGSDSGGSGEHSSDDRIEGSSRDDGGGGAGAGRRTNEKHYFHLVVGVKIAAYMRADRTAMRETWCVSLSVSLR